MTEPYAIRTQEEVGRLVGVSESRVGQIERSAFAKIRRAVEGDEELVEIVYEALNGERRPALGLSSRVELDFQTEEYPDASD